MATATATAADWTQWRYDAEGSGTNPDETVLSADTASQWRLRWEKKPSATKTYTTAAIVTTDAVYVGGSKVDSGGTAHAQVWAYALDGGQQLWVRRLPCGQVAKPSMALGNGMILATLTGCPAPNPFDDRIAMLNPQSGQKLAEVDLGARLSSPTVVGNQAIVDNFSSTAIEVIDLATRSHVDTIPYPETDFASSGFNQPLPVIDGDVWLNSGGVSPTVSDGIAIVDSSAITRRLDHGAAVHYVECPSFTQVCAVDLTTGQLLWTKDKATTGQFLIVGDVAYAVCDGRVGFPGQQWDLCGFDLRSGQQILFGEPAQSTFSVTAGSRPIYVNGLVLVGAHSTSRSDDVVLAYDTATETLEQVMTRQQRIEKYGAPGGAYLAIANGHLVTSVPSVRVVTFDR